MKNKFWVIIPSALLGAVVIFLAYKYANPAPPSRMVITTGDGEGDYLTYAKQYKEIIKQDGVDLEIRASSGAMENYQRLKDPKSDVDVGFVQDGLGSPEDAPDLSSLGSLYYEPIWVFYRAASEKGELTRFPHLLGKKVNIGSEGGGTRGLILRILGASGINEKNTHLMNLHWQEGATALMRGQLDAAVFLATPEEPLIKTLLEDKKLRLMNMDQAEAITKQIPFLHHLVLPHGTIDLEHNLPPQDVHMVSPTATLLVRDSLHPALAYLLLKAAAQIHSEPGIFEKKGEFPVNKDYQFPLSEDARAYYKSGAPFWQRYLPFWLANLVERFIIIVIPALALILPILRLFPQFRQWRIRSKIYHRYGELKYLETQVQLDTVHEKNKKYLDELDRIEERVNKMRVPIEFTEHLYGLRGHIDFVRGKLRTTLGTT